MGQVNSYLRLSNFEKPQKNIPTPASQIANPTGELQLSSAFKSMFITNSP